MLIGIKYLECGRKLKLNTAIKESYTVDTKVRLMWYVVVRVRW